MANRKQKKREGVAAGRGERDGVRDLASAGHHHPSIGMLIAAGGSAFTATRKAANDDDPFVAEFEKLAGNRKRDPYGQPFGDVSYVRSGRARS
jgi:hypothetical protein